ncbi:CRISPR-associated protein Cas3 [Streptomyces sp. AS58]|uniref:CRISPR-associated helicase/endonuclease Cas3 n=1 Tax=Streptomyces sp. AS58 TaxID=1519489 RepID=UPI0006B0656C|nr:CRISPR-associated helicase/endonuclease Cas3 [Streptomyces sp. AS58]KOV72256.1 CRISPR-associated protein Cas3 [Streptomyces sp. AS58]
MLGPGRLSAAACSVWAKSDQDVARGGGGWLPLWRHLADCGAVAGLLWDCWLPEVVRRRIGEVLPVQGDGRLLAVWLAGVHDIGKATPAFACQVDPLAERMRGAGLEMPSRAGMLDRVKAPHGLAGQVLLRDWLVECHGWSRAVTGQLAVVVGGHHGVPPEAGQVVDLDAHPELLRWPGPGEVLWARVQRELLDACADHFGVRERLGEWGRVRLPQTVQVLLSAVVIVSDWIASNRDLFPYFPEDRPRSDGERIEAAWRGLDLPGAWRPAVPRQDVRSLFGARFELPGGAGPRPVQEAVVRVAAGMAVPGLIVVEAPMGEGKTEAALAAAEVLAARSGAGGVFFALPTMATSNAMFPRVVRWLDRLAVVEGGERWSVRLAHSKASLNKGYAQLLKSSWRDIAAVDVDGGGGDFRPAEDRVAARAELVAHQWLRGRKRHLLSSFVVGTVDQLLMAGLRTRHLALRHLAVAGKVVVIDEAHAYDAYMNTYLERVLGWLGAYGVPVVVVSATLPADRRRRLAEAYAGAERDDPGFAGLREAEGYPLVTSVAPGGVPDVVEPGRSSRSGQVRVERLGDGLDVLAGRLRSELADGGCALVVRNTVTRVHATAQHLRGELGADGIEVSVAHARFLDLDRAAKDAELLRLFGPPGRLGGGEADPRPVRHVVVASQVAEQSLDVDFDLLVTDLAPVDLVLQRMGRLHRHQRRRPGRLGGARCLVTGVVDWQAQVPEPVRGSVTVYGRHALLRSAAVLWPFLEKGEPVRLPDEISPLVQGAYGGGVIGPDAWQEAMEAARLQHETGQKKKEREADTFRVAGVGKDGKSLAGWLRHDVGVQDAEDTRMGRAQVRDSGESLEVLVVQRHPDGSLTTVEWLPDGDGGLPLPVDAVPTARAARAAAASGLRLPVELSRGGIVEQVIAELEQFGVRAWQSKEAHWLEGQLILQVSTDCQTPVPASVHRAQARLAGYRLDYSSTDGLEVTREG